MGSIARPAEVAMFADGAIDNGSGAVEYTFLEPSPAVLQRMGSPYSMDPSVHFRHNDSALVAFVDGHVSPRRMAISVTSSPVYPGANPALHGLGWFGPTDVQTPYDPAP
jgi:prepilin-type processing-associated H-X9-DG protein